MFFVVRRSLLALGLLSWLACSSAGSNGAPQPAGAGDAAGGASGAAGTPDAVAGRDDASASDGRSDELASDARADQASIGGDDGSASNVPGADAIGAPADAGADAAGDAGTDAPASDGATEADAATGADAVAADAAAADVAPAADGPTDAALSCAPVDGGPAPTPHLPSVPGASDHLRPCGGAANLRVLPWAGFKAAVTYTFDDSQPSQFQHWPELKATGVPVTYFVTTVNHTIPGYDTTLREIAARGGELGNHTVNHCAANLMNCSGPSPLASIGAELDGCTDYLETQLGQTGVWTMAYPYGDTGYAGAARLRFFLGRGVRTGTIAAGDSTDPFDLPVISAVGGETAEKFSGDIDAARTQGQWAIFLFHSLDPTPDKWYADVDIASVTGSIDHAKALGDVWIDTMANVGAYWVAQKLITGAGPRWTWTLPAHFPPGKYLRVAIDGGTLRQGGVSLPWDPHGYYEVALDAGELTWSPQP